MAVLWAGALNQGHPCELQESVSETNWITGQPVGTGELDFWCWKLCQKKTLVIETWSWKTKEKANGRRHVLLEEVAHRRPLGQVSLSQRARWHKTASWATGRISTFHRDGECKGPEAVCLPHYGSEQTGKAGEGARGTITWNFRGHGWTLSKIWDFENFEQRSAMLYLIVSKMIATKDGPGQKQGSGLLERCFNGPSVNTWKCDLQRSQKRY